MAHAGAWLHQAGDGVAKCLSKSEFWLAVRWWLGCPLLSKPSACATCSITSNSFGHHAMACRSGHYTRRHNALCDVVEGRLTKAWYVVEREVGVSRGEQPAYLLIRNADAGRHLAIDVTGRQPHPDSTDSGYVAEARDAKVAKYSAKCCSKGWCFLPLVVTTFGALAEPTREFFDRWIRVVAGDRNTWTHPVEGSKWWSEVSTATMRCIARQLELSVPANHPHSLWCSRSTLTTSSSQTVQDGVDREVEIAAVLSQGKAHPAQPDVCPPCRNEVLHESIASPFVQQPSLQPMVRISNKRAGAEVKHLQPKAHNEQTTPAIQQNSTNPSAAATLPHLTPTGHITTQCGGANFNTWAPMRSMPRTASSQSTWSGWARHSSTSPCWNNTTQTLSSGRTGDATPPEIRPDQHLTEQQGILCSSSSLHFQCSSTSREVCDLSSEARARGERNRPKSTVTTAADLRYSSVGRPHSPGTAPTGRPTPRWAAAKGGEAREVRRESENKPTKRKCSPTTSKTRRDYNMKTRNRTTNTTVLIGSTWLCTPMGDSQATGHASHLAGRAAGIGGASSKAAQSERCESLLDKKKKLLLQFLKFSFIDCLM